MGVTLCGPAFRADRTDAVSGGRQELPIRIEANDSAGKSAGGADDCNGSVRDNYVIPFLTVLPEAFKTGAAC